MNDDKITEEEKKKLPEEESTEIDTAPTTEIDMPEDKVAVDHSEHTHAAASSNSDVSETWIKLVNGKFTCSECENEVEPETNTIEGVVKADLNQIKADLTEFPTKVIYGICPVCGMEFVFRLKSGDLYLEPSDLEK